MSNYYRKEPIREFTIDTTMYEQIKNVNQDNLDLNAVGYFGTNYKYWELLKKVDALAASYKKAGVKEGDIVPIVTINTPEVAEILLALNKIGATSKWVDLRSTDEQLIKYINEGESKLFIGLDKLMPRMANIVNETDIEKVISISPTNAIKPLRVLRNSLEDFKKLLENAKEQKKEPSIIMPNDPRFTDFDSFLKNGKNEQAASVAYNKDRPALIVQSSGTTGLAKSIVHTDYSVNNLIYNVSFSDLPFYKGNTLLTVVPPWIAYGLIDTIYLSLAFGMKAELSPKVDGDIVYDYLGKFDLAFASPLHYRFIAENIDKVDPKKLDRMMCLITGGDAIKKEELEELESLLGKSIYNGYGSNEVVGCATVNPYKANKHGSVGIPLCHNEVKAFDINTEEELPPYQNGELCIKTEQIFTEYLNKLKETKEVRKIHKDGTIWMHTGDLGYIDEDNYVYVIGRLKRTIIRKAFKIFPGTIEEVLLSHPAVNDCVVVGVNDTLEGSVPMAFVTLKPEYFDKVEKVLEELDTLTNEKLKDYERPKYTQVIEAIPYTINSKQDYRALEDLGNNFVCENEKKLVRTNKK